MSIDIQKPALEAAVPSVLAKQGELPRWAPWAILGGALVVVGALLAATGFSIGLWLVGSAVVYAVATYAISRGVEGRRKATDRLVTILVTIAFLLALIPLVSVIVVVVENGLARFDVAFFTQSMRGVVGEGGGGYHAIMGTLIITALAAAMSVPIGLLAAVYLVEYGRGRLARAITFFVDVMTGIPSIVAGLFAFALFALFLGPSDPDRVHGLGGAVGAHDPGRGAVDRGDAARSCPTNCARRHTRWACRNGARSSRSCCPRRSLGSPPGSRSPSRGSSARPRRCSSPSA